MAISHTSIRVCDEKDILLFFSLFHIRKKESLTVSGIYNDFVQLCLLTYGKVVVIRTS